MYKSIVQQIAQINCECFGIDDYYSNVPALFSFLSQEGVGIFTTRHYDKISGYLLYTNFGTHIESIRRAVTKGHRSRGLGIKLSKRLIKLAKHKNKNIHTYVSKTNLVSLNTNLKVGYRITNICKDYVYIMYKIR